MKSIEHLIEKTIQAWFSSRSNFLLPTILVFTALGCGGGGGGSSSPTSNTNTNTSTPPPSVTFTASATSVTAGDSVTLNWQTSNVDSCEASGGWTGSQPTSGSTNSGAINQNTSFSLSCSGSGGSALREIDVQVSSTASININFDSSDSVVLLSDQVQLNWNVSNADRCEASGAWSGDQPLSGNFTSNSLQSDTTFKLTCFSQAESAIALVTVVVTDPTLRWTAPTENVDGSALTDLAAFRVYWGGSSRSYNNSTELDATAGQWDIGLGSGTYYFAVTAIDADDDESAYSNEVQKVIP